MTAASSRKVKSVERLTNSRVAATYSSSEYLNRRLIGSCMGILWTVRNLAHKKFFERLPHRLNGNKTAFQTAHRSERGVHIAFIGDLYPRSGRCRSNLRAVV